VDTFTLTADNDTFVASASGSTVHGSVATLTPGDSLTGGAGTDVLALVGTGFLHVDQLATFTGFEKITLDNANPQFADLWLGSQPIEVDATGYAYILVDSSANWNGSNVIKGDPAGATNVQFSNSGPNPVTYDLTSNTFSGVSSVGTASIGVTLLIDNSVTAGVGSFTSISANDKLVTASSTLDLSHTPVSGFAVASTNGSGTSFNVGDLVTALQIAGGPGHDTITTSAFTFTAAERNAIFATSSVETIVDPSGTYNAPAPSPDIVGLTAGQDTFVAPASGSTVYGTAATMAFGPSGDSLTGGAGTDVLALVGPGNFALDQLATFTGFEEITLDNPTSQVALLTLGSQPIEVDATGYAQILANSSANWNGSNVIKGDPAGATDVYFRNFTTHLVTYDLTSNTFSGVEPPARRWICPIRKLPGSLSPVRTLPARPSVSATSPPRSRSPADRATIRFKPARSPLPPLSATRSLPPRRSRRSPIPAGRTMRRRLLQAARVSPLATTHLWRRLPGRRCTGLGRRWLRATA
jgi:hypothetical protein